MHQVLRMTESKHYSLEGKRVWVAGHRGMAGSAIVRRLQREQCEILTATHGELDLTRQVEVEAWMQAKRPQAVFLAAAKVGGIMANATRPAEFLYDNLAIEANVIHAAWRTGVEKLLFLGSSCIYPRMAPQPMSEEQLLTGPLEATNEWYAIAKIAGIKLCQAYRKQYGCDFISAMPTNLYGPEDNFDLESSHVLPAMIRKFHEAKERGERKVKLWGSGAPRREFLHVDDLADACLFLMRRYEGDEHINVGTGEDLSIRSLAELVRDIVAPELTIEWDAAKPDGSPRKLLDVRRLHDLGWRHRVEVPDGIAATYRWFVDELAKGGVRGVHAPGPAPAPTAR